MMNTVHFQDSDSLKNQARYRFLLAAAALSLAVSMARAGPAPVADADEPVKLPVFTVEGADLGLWPPLSAGTGVLNREALSRTGAASVPDLRGRSPNWEVSEGPVRSYGSIYTLRGVGNTPYFGPSAVPVIVDGVPMGDAYTTALDLYDLESTVMRSGPQGALFGRNCPGGVLEIRTRAPDSRPRLETRAAYGTYDARSLRLAAGIPLVQDQLFLGLAGRYAGDDGFIENNVSDGPWDSRRSLGGRVNLRWTPDSAWDARAGVSRTEYQDGAQRLTSLAGDPFETSAGLRGESEIHREGQHIRLSRNCESLRFTYLGARTFWRVDPYTADLDFSPVNAFVSTVEQSQERWLQELHVESPFRHREQTRWRVGVYWETANSPGMTARNFGGFADRTHFDLDEDTWALFGLFSTVFAEKGVLHAGFRFEETEKSVRRVKPFAAKIEQKDSFSNFAPDFGLAWTVTDTLNLYAKTACGYKPGGFSAYASDPDLAHFDEEKFWASEAGLRYLSSDGRILLRGAAYYYDIDDYQVERSYDMANYVVLNAPRAVSRGVEIAGEIRPAEGLDLGLRFGWCDATFEDYTSPPAGVALEGRNVPYTPEFTAAATVQYAHSKGWTGRLEYLAFGDKYFDEANSPAFRQSAYGLFNAQIGWQGGLWAFSVWGKNLADETYYTSIIPNLNAGSPGEPRTFGASVSLLY